MGTWLDKALLGKLLAEQPPEFQKTAQMYMSEANFFEPLINEDLTKLQKSSTIVEIGSGIGLLSRLIASEGFRVIAFEPMSSGFSVMDQIHHLIEKSWIGPDVDVERVSEPFSPRIDLNGQVDYLFAVNVIEHVPNYPVLIRDAAACLSTTGFARMICPNYAFPYEPHFNMLTLYSKRLTKKIQSRKILNSKIEDPWKFWLDLSWPTVRGVRAILRDLGLEGEFSREACLRYVSRLTETEFLMRKGWAFRAMLRPTRLFIQVLVRYLPISLLPIMDFRIRLVRSPIVPGVPSTL